jgi:hypothetical protein
MHMLYLRIGASSFLKSKTALTVCVMNVIHVTWKHLKVKVRFSPWRYMDKWRYTSIHSSRCTRLMNENILSYPLYSVIEAVCVVTGYGLEDLGQILSLNRAKKFVLSSVQNYFLGPAQPFSEYCDSPSWSKLLGPEGDHLNSVALSPQANCTDWATVTCRRHFVLTFVDRGVSRGQRGGSPPRLLMSVF